MVGKALALVLLAAAYRRANFVGSVVGAITLQARGAEAFPVGPAVAVQHSVLVPVLGSGR